jgi:hypothetical protein
VAEPLITIARITASVPARGALTLAKDEDGVWGAVRRAFPPCLAHAEACRSSIGAFDVLAPAWTRTSGRDAASTIAEILVCDRLGEHAGSVEHLHRDDDRVVTVLLARGRGADLTYDITQPEDPNRPSADPLPSRPLPDLLLVRTEDSAASRTEVEPVETVEPRWVDPR